MQADYIDKKLNQSMLWANGKPTHDHVYNECCHDFSCCIPDLFEQDAEKRYKIHAEFVDKLLERRRQGDE